MTPLAVAAARWRFSNARKLHRRLRVEEDRTGAKLLYSNGKTGEGTRWTVDVAAVRRACPGVLPDRKPDELVEPVRNALEELDAAQRAYIDDRFAAQEREIEMLVDIVAELRREVARLRAELPRVTASDHFPQRGEDSRVQDQSPVTNRRGARNDASP